jgi:SNF2 family DNA or RNA helicase
MSKANLLVELSDQSLVSLTFDEGLDRKFWIPARTFWMGASTSTINDFEIVLEIGEFVERMQWLRSNWTELGHTVSISSHVVDIIKRIRSGVAEFEALLTPRHFDTKYVVPVKLSRSLTDHQLRNVQLLMQMANGANFSVPGAGKTMTALVSWQILRSRGLVDKLLVVCPRSAFDAWKTELKLSFPNDILISEYSGEFIDPSIEVLITNYEQLENLSKVKYLTSWALRNNANLIIDEAHRVKGGGRSVRWRGCYELAKVAKRVDILTGTPMPQGLSDLTSLFRLAWPKLPPRTFTESTVRGMSRNGGFVRTTKEELDLPPIEISRVSSDLSPLQKQIYDALIDQYSGTFRLQGRDAASMARRGKAIMSLISAATNPMLLGSKDFGEFSELIRWPPTEITSNTELMHLVHEYGIHEIPWKLQWVAKYIQDASSEGRKVLVWSSFVGNLLTLKRVLEPYNPALVYGGTPIDERDTEIDRFRKDSNCFVLLTNPQTLGEGISLHKECHEAIYLDRTFNAGLYLQSLDRIHRLGLDQGTRTRISILQSAGTVDDRIDSRLDAKIKRLSNFLNDEGLVRVALPNTDDPHDFDLIGLEDDDLKSMFGHLSG